jgi:hypothetical protein
MEGAEPDWKDLAHVGSKPFYSFLNEISKSNLGCFSDLFVLFINQNSTIMIQEERQKILMLLRVLLNRLQILIKLLEGLAFGDWVLLLYSLEYQDDLLGQVHQFALILPRFSRHSARGCRWQASVLVGKVLLRQLPKDINP